MEDYTMETRPAFATRDGLNGPWSSCARWNRRDGTDGRLGCVHGTQPNQMRARGLGFLVTTGDVPHDVIFVTREKDWQSVEDLVFDRANPDSPNLSRLR